MYRRFCRWNTLVVAGLLVGMSRPVSAQTITTGPQTLPFPVLAGGDFPIDPASTVASELFSIANGALNLRADSHGWVDMEPYCRIPDRHWGPVSVASCSLEVTGVPSQTGPALPARIALDHMAAGSTITLRLLVQAPLIVLDLEGNPTAVMDTFVEEYRWKVVGSP